MQTDRVVSHHNWAHKQGFQWGQEGSVAVTCGVTNGFISGVTRGVTSERYKWGHSGSKVGSQVLLKSGS